MQLERDPENRDLVQAIFRATHTLKGSSAAMGLTAMAELLHAMEDVLSLVREGALAVTAPIIDTLLFSLDRLHVLEQGLATQQTAVLEGPETAQVVQALHALLAAPVPLASAQPLPPAAPLPDGCVTLRVGFTPDCQLPDIRAYMVLQALGRLGDVVYSDPTAAQIDAGEVGTPLLLTVALRTMQDEATLHQAVAKIIDVAEVSTLHDGAPPAPAAPPVPVAAPAPAAAEDAPAPVSAPAGSQTVRVNVETLDSIMNLVGEMVLDRTRVERLTEELRGARVEDETVRELDTVAHHLGAIVRDLHEQVLETRMLQVRQLFNRFPRLVRDLCHTLGKDVTLELEGENERLDRSVIEKLVDPLTHILRNSLDHGMETPAARAAAGKAPTGTVRLTARRSEGYILIQVQDDGPGINLARVTEKARAAGLVSAETLAGMSRQEQLGLIFASGLSTAQAVSDVSGRGVGMDVVKRNIEALSGAILVQSEAGRGTTMTLKIPLTLAIVRALLVRVGQVSLAIPLAFVEETMRVPRQSLHSVRGCGLLQWRDRVVPVVPLGHIFPGCGTASTRSMLHLVAIGYMNQLICLAVDGITGHQEIVVKSLGGYLGKIPGLAGATILGNGHVALIADVGNLFEQQLIADALRADRRLTAPAAGVA